MTIDEQAVAPSQRSELLEGELHPPPSPGGDRWVDITDDASGVLPAVDSECKTTSSPQAASASAGESGSAPESDCESEDFVNMAEIKLLDTSSLDLRSPGGRNHEMGRCKPCAFFHTKGCNSGSDCQFCHKCPAFEKQRRNRLRRRRLGAHLAAMSQPMGFKFAGHSRCASGGSMASCSTAASRPAHFSHSRQTSTASTTAEDAAGALSPGQHYPGHTAMPLGMWGAPMMHPGGPQCLAAMQQMIPMMAPSMLQHPILPQQHQLQAALSQRTGDHDAPTDGAVSPSSAEGASGGGSPKTPKQYPALSGACVASQVQPQQMVINGVSYTLVPMMMPPTHTGATQQMPTVSPSGLEQWMVPPMQGPPYQDHPSSAASYHVPLPSYQYSFPHSGWA